MPVSERSREFNVQYDALRALELQRAEREARMLNEPRGRSVRASHGARRARARDVKRNYITFALAFALPLVMGYVVYPALGFAWAILLAMPVAVVIAVLAMTNGQGSRDGCH